MDKPSTPQTEKIIPHSGDLKLEQPVRHYTETPLGEATFNDYEALDHEKEVPVNIDFSQAVPVETIKSAPEKKKLNKVQRIGVGALASILVVGGGIFGVNQLANGSNNEPEPNDDKGTNEVAEDPAPNPSEVITEPNETSGELTVESLKIPSTLSPEEAAITFVKNGFSDRQMQGATQETQDAYYAAGGDISSIEKIATENAAIENAALLKPGWEVNENLVNYNNHTTEANVSYVAVWAVTKDSGFPQDIEPFKAWTDVDATEVLSSNETTAEVKIDVTDYNNSDKNRAGEIDPIFLELNGKKATIMLDLEKVGDSWVVADMDTSPRQ